MSTLDPDSPGGATASAHTRGTGQVAAGRFVLVVGGLGGTIVRLVPAGPTGESGDLAKQVKQGERQKRSKRAAAAAGFEDRVEQASGATDAVEKAISLFKALAEHRIDPKELSGGLDDLLGLLERFDKEGRLVDVVRLGRAVSGVLALAERWGELARTLHETLSAAERVSDPHAVAWANHELGTLHLCAENPAEAEHALRQAREMRDQLADRRGLAATDHNLTVLCRLLQEFVSDRRLIEPGRLIRRLLLLGLMLAVVLGGGAAAAVITGSATGPPVTTDRNSSARVISFISGAPPAGKVGVPYAGFTFRASGDASITYSVQAGEVPGLALSREGVLSGTPTRAGRFSLTVTATGASGARKSERSMITIAAAAVSASISFTSGAPPAGTVGQAYSGFTFTASGDKSITYALTAGTVPGLTLSPDGSLSGTPTQPGMFSVTVTATGASGATTSAQQSIVISAPNPS
jgi:hypothetical protein